MVTTRILALLILFGLLPPSVSAQFNPQFEQSTIQIDAKVVKPLQVISPWRNAHRSGGHSLVVKDDVAMEVDPATGKERWSLKTEDGAKLEWLVGDNAVAYFKSARPEAKVRRLDLDKAKWQDPLLLVVKGEKTPNEAEVRDALIDDKTMVLLSTEKATGDSKIENYRVSLFEGKETTPVWSKAFQAAQERAYTGGLLWAARRPDYAVSSIQSLNWVGKHLLVCAGPRQDLLCLDHAKGKEVWRLPRVWEFDRGFTGPSVWSNHLSRFGLDSFTEYTAKDPSGIVNYKDKKGVEAQQLAQKDAKAELASARKEHEDQYDCSLVAGPVVLPDGKALRGDQDHSILVAIAKGPNRGGWSGYRSDCIVYEIDDRGQLIGRARVPRMVNGWQFGKVENGVVWSCQKGGLLRLGLSRNDWHGGMMGQDMICNVEWFRQFRAEQSKAWLSSDAAGPITAFVSAHAFCVLTGGYVLKENESIYRFPIMVVDLDSIQSRALTLAVPFKGKVPLPKTNYSGDGKSTHAFGPYMVGITGLRAEGNVLGVILGMEGSAVRLDFPLREFMKPQGRE